MSMIVVLGFIAAVLAGIPTPTLPPEPTPAPTATPEPTRPIAPTPEPEPPLELQPAGDSSTTPLDAPVHEAWPVNLTVRACMDLNGDRRCTLGEGIYGLPAAMLDAQTGTVLAMAQTDPEGIARVDLTLPEHAELSIDVPYLALSQWLYPGQRGVEIVVPAVTLPTVLP